MLEYRNNTCNTWLEQDKFNKLLLTEVIYMWSQKQ